MRRTFLSGLMLAAGCAGSAGQDDVARVGAQALGGGVASPFAEMGGGAAAGTGSSTASYGGGPVISAVRIVAVYWGPNVSATITSGIGGFYAAMTDSAYLDKLGEYYSKSALLGPIGRGTYAGSITITPGDTSTSLQDADIVTEIAAQIGAGSLPAPDANTLYMVHFPPGVTISAFGQSSCAGGGFCAYHEAGTRQISGSSVTFKYGVLPDFGPGSGCDTGCGGGTEFQNFTSTASHEIAEAITDPEPFSGWTGEIGDPCNQNHDTITAPDGTSYTVQKTWSNAANACVTVAPDCQGASDTYGIAANQTFGAAPPEVQTWWTANGCSTSPRTSADLCQKMSEVFGIVAGQTFGYAPPSVQSWWVTNQCGSAPLTSDSLCQRASDTYGIVPFQSWGSAPSGVQSWWVANSCNASPRAESACQMAAELYGIIPFQSWGSAPSGVQSWWVANSCNATPVNNACQDASDRYGIVANQTFGFAPTDVQTWWAANACATSPVSGDTCQRASELYGIAANQTFGYAPASVQTWWKANSCSTQPLFSADACQRASDTFGIVANETFGFAPADVQTWWRTNGCETHPRTVTRNFQ